MPIDPPYPPLGKGGNIKKAPLFKGDLGGSKLFKQPPRLIVETINLTCLENLYLKRLKSMLSNTFRRILVASGLTVATSFMTVLSASAITTGANSTGKFAGSIDPSCAVIANFPENAIAPKAYTKTAYSGSGDGGVSQLTSSQEAEFNCNSDTIDVSATVSVTKPANPSNATALAAEHQATLSSMAGGGESDSQPNPTSLTGASWKTDSQGNIKIGIQSTWQKNTNLDGEELLNGPYSATFVVTVTPN